MTAKPEVDEIRLSRVLFLLALSVFINYLDRGNLSIAAPLLKNEFQLSATQLGVLLSSFFWTYSFFLPLSGWLVDRLDVKWVIASGFSFGLQQPRLPARCMHSAHYSSRDWRWAQENRFLIQHARPFCRGIYPSTDAASPMRTLLPAWRSVRHWAHSLAGL